MKISNTMKKIILLIGLLVCATAAQVVFGQTLEGSIIYEVKVNVHRNMPAQDEEMKKMVPEFNIHKDQLFFNANETLYKTLDEEEDAEPEDESSGGGMRMRFTRPKSEHYFNQASFKRVLLQEFMGKKFLIEDSIKITPWKLGTATKEVLGYTCKQATYFNEDRKQNIVAWYTDKLRPFMGPEGFVSLPGTVMQIDINEGERTLTAQKVESRPLVKGEMKIPTGGQKITEKDFRKLVEEQVKRMGGSGGRVIIRN
jgi:GLPGLI family protein